MNTKVIGAGVVLAIAIGIVGCYFPTAKVENKETNLGTAAGPIQYATNFFLAGATIGGTSVASSSQGAATLSASTLQELGIITQTAPAALTLTLPASTTLSNIVPNVGDARTVYISGLTSSITVAGGTGTLLQSASTSVVISAGRTAQLTFVRKANTDVQVLMVH